VPHGITKRSLISAPFPFPSILRQPDVDTSPKKEVDNDYTIPITIEARNFLKKEEKKTKNLGSMLRKDVRVDNAL